MISWSSRSKSVTTRVDKGKKSKKRQDCEIFKFRNGDLVGQLCFVKVGTTFFHIDITISRAAPGYRRSIFFTFLAHDCDRPSFVVSPAFTFHSLRKPISFATPPLISWRNIGGVGAKVVLFSTNFSPNRLFKFRISASRGLVSVINELKNFTDVWVFNFVPIIYLEKH